ncbi:hypothetical protein [Streptomyces sparsogenes]|uniref:DUF4352 domain-containing protein n=1 Tax=Streptomyces sparsogenes DSM 40356 TaxID=1331668 RepID=A0A1R1S7R2_9ACTN|nr:hypothetical protein [Streptomyces sparsogenes]OMI34355.1 hypothetical protein SPAR_36266 [Streptomyces sparsogenes DSM 40356]
MRRCAIAALILAASLPLTACSGSDNKDSSKDAKPKAAGKTSFDCDDPNGDQAAWVEHCADEKPAPAEQSSTGLAFGKTYTWPDGLKVSVVDAREVTKFGEYDSTPDPGETGFRVELKLTNTGKAAAKLDDLSLIVEGATNGGEAATTTYETGSDPLEGRLAPGMTVTKNDDSVLGTKYGKKIVVTVQRSSENFDLEFPEFSGTIQ